MPKLSDFRIKKEIVSDFKNKERTLTHYKLKSKADTSLNLQQENTSSSTVGSIALRDDEKPRADVYNGKPFTKIEVMQVREKHRGKGISKLLHEQAKNHSLSIWEACRVLLRATPGEGSPTAIIYKKSGYKPIGLSSSEESLLGKASESKAYVDPKKQTGGAANFSCDMYLPE